MCNGTFRQSESYYRTAQLLIIIEGLKVHLVQYREILNNIMLL